VNHPRLLPLVLVLAAASPAAAGPPRSPRLMRHQVDWFGARLEEDWPGIGDRSIGTAEVGALVARIKEELGKARGRPLSGGDRWSVRNDVELQEMLDSGRQRGLREFPGPVWRPLPLDDLRDAIEAAFARYAALSGADPRDELGVTPTLMVAWTIKESDRNPYASPYASTSARSTATGLLQITRTTYDDLVRRRRFPGAALAQGLLPEAWDEVALSDPVTNLLAALFVLKEKARGREDVEAALGRYYGSTDPAANARYAGGVLRGDAYLREQLGGAELPDDLDAGSREVSALLRETGRRVRRP